MSGSSGKTILANIPAREWRGLTPEWAGGRLRIPLKCSECGGEDHWSATRVINPNTAIPKIIQMGWKVGGKLLCPICVVAHRNHARPNLTIVENAMTNNVTKLETGQATAAARETKKLVFLALMDYYDEAKRAYKPGHSDKTIAASCNAAEAFVKSIREADFGPLDEPEDIARFREEILKMHVSLDTLKRNFTALCNRNGWKV